MKDKTQRYDREYYRGRNSNYIFWYSNLRFRIFWRRRIRFLSKIADSGRLLDIGCAFGFFIKFLEKDFDVYGVDIAEYAVARARQILTSPERVKIFDIQSGIPFKEKFDVITAFDIMEHIVRPLPVFEILYSMLERHGYLYMEVPLKDTLINRDVGHHYRPLHEWTDLLKEAGFEPRSVQTYYTIGFRSVMISTERFINYCSIIAHKLD